MTTMSASTGTSHIWFKCKRYVSTLSPKTAGAYAASHANAMPTALRGFGGGLFWEVARLISVAFVRVVCIHGFPFVGVEVVADVKVQGDARGVIGRRIARTASNCLTRGFVVLGGQYGQAIGCGLAVEHSADAHLGIVGVFDYCSAFQRCHSAERASATD